MKKLLAALTLALLLSLALGMSVANATHSNGEGPDKRDFVRGTGQIAPTGNLLDFQLHVNAWSDPAGLAAQGHFTEHSKFPAGRDELDFDFSGEVTCLRVTGNRAVVGGRVEKSKTGRPREGTGVLIWIRDAGEGNEPNDAFTRFPVATPPATCPTFFIEFPGSQGNFVVHDAPTTP